MSAFTDWIEKEHPLTARAAAAEKKDGTFTLVRDAMEIGWNAALHAMVHRLPAGEAARLALSLRSEIKSTVERGK